MTEHSTAHLTVIEGSRPVGVVSTLDIAAALGGGPLSHSGVGFASMSAVNRRDHYPARRLEQGGLE
jgi:CBS domain-containing protein